MVKRIFAIALTLVLGLGLLVPAMAAEPVEIHPMRPIITREPVFPSHACPYEAFVVYIEAECPQGIGKITIQWFRGDISSSVVATGSRAELYVRRHRDQVWFNVVVTNTWTDEYGVEQTTTTRWDGSVIYVNPFVPFIPFWQRVFNFFSQVLRILFFPIIAPLSILVTILAIIGLGIAGF